MKVLIDARTTQDEINFNGVGRYSRLVIEHLIKNFPNTQFDLIMYNSFSTLDEILTEIPKNVRIIRIGNYNQKGTLNMIVHNLDLFFHVRLNKVLRNYDKKGAVFFSPYFWRGLPVFKIPTVSMIHDFALPFYNSYSTISPVHNILRFIHYWYELIWVHFAKEIIVPSQYSYDDTLKYLPGLKKERVNKILLGVFEDFGQSEFEKYLPSDWRKKEYFIYIGGGVTPNKNSEGVASGFANFINKLKNEGREETDLPYLVIAGKNFIDEYSHDSKGFRDYVDSLGITKLVHYTGKYDDVSRWDLLKNSLGFIHLSLFEGFGFSVAEAMRAKVPVIAHNGTTYPEVVGDCGILVDGLNPEVVGDSFMKLYKDREYAKELGMKGYEKSLEYDWNNVAKETYKLFERALNGSR